MQGLSRRWHAKNWDEWLNIYDVSALQMCLYGKLSKNTPDITVIPQFWSWSKIFEISYNKGIEKRFIFNKNLRLHIFIKIQINCYHGNHSQFLVSVFNRHCSFERDLFINQKRHSTTINVKSFISFRKF